MGFHCQNWFFFLLFFGCSDELLKEVSSLVRRNPETLTVSDAASACIRTLVDLSNLWFGESNVYFAFTWSDGNNDSCK